MNSERVWWSITQDDCCFSYPCGQGHRQLVQPQSYENVGDPWIPARLHYHCMLHFLGSILAIPLSDETPGPLRKEQVRGADAANV